MQAQTSEEGRQVSARLQRERDQAVADAAWLALTEEERDASRAKQREKEKLRRSIFGLALGSTR